jgi:hypothetical protein
MAKLLILASALLCSVLMVGSGAAQTAVTTYHYDNLRTGWNQTETVLNTTNVKQNFQLLHTVQLDPNVYDQVDAQPLYVPSQYIAPNADSPSGGTYDVVFIATESNRVYAIDASAGVIVNRKLLGPPVPHAVVPGGFAGPTVGIYGTPVIDPETQTLYVIDYVYVNNSTPTYQLHALDLSTFADKGNSPLTVSPSSAPISQLLTNKTTLTFNAAAELQRTGLVLVFERVGPPAGPYSAIAHLYAGFGSFNDIPPGRGWLLGWTAANGAGGITLAQLPESLLLNTQPQSPFDGGGSSIWMSSYGIASAGGYSSAAAAVRGRGGKGTQPELFFTTGNDTGPHDGAANISESVVQVSGVDASVIGVFTPTNNGYLDSNDLDFSSGGVMLLPPQSGKFPDLAVAAGKDGNLYLLNRDAWSISGPSTAAVLNQLPPTSQTPQAQTDQNLGSCFCGPSYFIGSDGISRIVTSQGASPGNQDGPSSLITYQLVPSPSGQPVLSQEGIAPVPTNPTTSFFTVVSSKGMQAGSAIIWAVASTPSTKPEFQDVTLYAFDAAARNGTLQPLFPPLRAGTWPINYHTIAVPVVADGKVFVGSNNQLIIFGAAPLTCPPGEGWIEKGNGYQCIPIPACPAACRDGCLIDNVPPGPVRFICKIFGKIP